MSGENPQVDRPIWGRETPVPDQTDPGIFIYLEVCAHGSVTGWNAFLRGAFRDDGIERSLALYGQTPERLREIIAYYRTVGAFRLIGVPPEQRPPHVRVFSPDGGWLGACCPRGTGR